MWIGAGAFQNGLLFAIESRGRHSGKRVSVNGRAVDDPEFPVRLAHDGMNDQIEVDGRPIQKQPRIYLV